MLRHWIASTGLGLLLILGGLDVRAQQLGVVRPAVPVASEQIGSGAITGVVVDATSGQPVAGAVVTLEERRLGSRPRSRAQVSTPKGRFAFVDLPASDSYFLTAAKSGYLDGGYGRTDPRGPAMPLSLGKDQWLRDIRTTLSKPGSISGTVVDERGEPVVGILVRLLPQILMSGRTQWLAGPVARTDDRGAYRIAGLGPGRYLVSVPSVQSALPATAAVRPPTAMAGGGMADLLAMRDASRQERLIIDVGDGQQIVVGRFAVPPPPGPDGTRRAYPMTFHPNVVDAASATSIDLTASEDRFAVDIQLRPVRALRVSGVVQGPREAVGNRLLRLMSTGSEDLGQGSEAAITMTMADGRFTFVDVPSGSYVVDSRSTLMELSHTAMAGVQTAVPIPVAFPARNATTASVKAAPPGVKLASLYDGTDGGFWGQVRVEVSNRDVDDVALTLRPHVTMTGRIVWAAGSTPSASLFLGLEPADGRRSLGVLTPRGGPGTESFAFDGLMAGEYFLRVLIGDATIESIAWEGRDYTDRPFDASAGRDLQGVVVTLTSAVSSMSGIVTDSSGAMTSGAAVIAFPVNPDRWSNYGFTPPRLTSVLTTADGRFRVDGLPAGDYYLLAVPASLERAWLDPAFLASRAARATRVRIERSETKVSNLTLSLIK